MSSDGKDLTRTKRNQGELKYCGELNSEWLQLRRFNKGVAIELMTRTGGD